MLTAPRRWLSAVARRVAGPGPGDTRASASLSGDLFKGLVGLVVLAVLAAPVYVLTGMPGKRALPAEVQSMMGWASLVGVVCWALLFLAGLVLLIGRAIEWAGYRFARGVVRAVRQHKPDDSK